MYLCLWLIYRRRGCNEWKKETRHECAESKTTRITMTAVRHVTFSSGLRKFQAAWFLLNRVYMRGKRLKWAGQVVRIFDKKNLCTNIRKMFRGRRPTGNPKTRWKCEVRMNTVKFLNRKSWRASARHEWLEEENKDVMVRDRTEEQ